MLKERLLPTICSHLPLSVFNKILGVNPLVAYYHIVTDADVPHVKHLYRFRDVKAFVQDMETLCRIFQPISVLDVIRSLKSGARLPANALLLTFDDGFREMHDIVAPILRKKGIPATFFIISGCVDNKGMPHHNKISLLLEFLGETKRTLPEKQIWSMLGAHEANGRTLDKALLSVDYTHRQVIDDIAHLLDYDVA